MSLVVFLRSVWLPRTSHEMKLEGGRAPSEFVQGGVRVYCVCCGCAVCSVCGVRVWCV